MTGISINRKNINSLEMVKTYIDDNGGIKAVAIVVRSDACIVDCFEKLESYYLKERSR